MASLIGIIAYFIGIMIAAFLYFLPSLVALYRKKRNLIAIFLLNLLLGWTGLGWVVALVWSAMKEGS